MACELCGQKMMNCNCTDAEREAAERIAELESELSELKERHSNEVQPTDAWDGLYWSYNCPLQMWGNAEDGWRVVNYMPRKGSCIDMETRVTAEEKPRFCRNAAARLRNLANLFDAMADGKIETIYYPDETVEEAIAKQEEDE